MIHEVCKDIVVKARINRFIETGTYLGSTVIEVSTWLQKLDPEFGTIKSYQQVNQIGYPVFENVSENSKTKLYSIDIDEQRQTGLQKLFVSNSNIKLINASSAKYIEEMISTGLITDNDNCFFFLDAHWGEYWPLRDEIRVILQLKRSIIVIDDFVVPFHPEAGFDIYGNNVCNWYYIKNLFNKTRINLYYPRKLSKGNRGAGIVFVGYQKKELEFMKGLPCYEPFFKGDLYFTELKVRVIHTKLYSFIKKKLGFIGSNL
ncbi:MAG: hypothetical protein WC955_09040 [Elusimicrobiota bacterium]